MKSLLKYVACTTFDDQLNQKEQRPKIKKILRQNKIIQNQQKITNNLDDKIKTEQSFEENSNQENYQNNENEVESSKNQDQDGNNINSQDQESLNEQTNTQLLQQGTFTFNQQPLLHISLTYNEQNFIVPIYNYSSELTIKQSLIQLNLSQENLLKVYQICIKHLQYYLKTLETIWLNKNNEKIDNIYFLQNLMNEQSFVQTRNQNSFWVKKKELRNGQIQIDIEDKEKEYRLVFQKFKILQFIQSQKLLNIGKRFSIDLNKSDDFLKIIERFSNDNQLTQKSRDELKWLIQNELIGMFE
ncbi:unnamed protein product [Paramecium primaurelia]|uniref:Uncharacterized protein n=1 Tax=Paramecium primaurelia TaxID=5886 RepID=A0A8S1MEC5_PARPR|nr:unnamed protein product [Paramecium primaurelia]